jgi:hypothetical protein
MVFGELNKFVQPRRITINPLFSWPGWLIQCVDFLNPELELINITKVRVTGTETNEGRQLSDRTHREFAEPSGAFFYERRYVRFYSRVHDAASDPKLGCQGE